MLLPIYLSALQFCSYDENRIASRAETFVTDSRMSEIFDAYYANGLGFENEINIDRKRQNPVGEYAKNFDANIISGNDVMNN